jgi:hypothetical protein
VVRRKSWRRQGRGCFTVTSFVGVVMLVSQLNARSRLVNHETLEACGALRGLARHGRDGPGERFSIGTTFCYKCFLDPRLPRPSCRVEVGGWRNATACRVLLRSWPLSHHLATVRGSSRLRSATGFGEVTLGNRGVDFWHDRVTSRH